MKVYLQAFPEGYDAMRFVKANLLTQISWVYYALAPCVVKD
jgi:hypothetical protein